MPSIPIRTLALAFCLLGLSRAWAAQPPPQRDFYQALDDTLGDFEHDLKQGTVTGLSNLSIRRVQLSERVPPSFRKLLENELTERILRATKTRVIECLGCRARRGRLGDERLEMSSPQTDPRELARLAKRSHIEHFLDASFSYQPTGLELSLTIADPFTREVLWSRTYNSETSRAAMRRRGADLDAQDASTRRATEYPPSLQYRLRVDYLFEPDTGGTTGCLGFAFRMVERYDNRKKEIGFEAEYLRSSSTLLGSSSSSTDLYSGINATLLFIHAWNLIASAEDFNQARASLFGGIGGTYASGFLGALVRAGFEERLARHFAVDVGVGYRPASTEFLPTTTGVSISGLEYGGGISFLF